ncbi:MAG: sensor histidine kinase [Synechococcus sp.]
MKQISPACLPFDRQHKQKTAESSTDCLEELGDFSPLASLDMRGVCRRQVEELTEQLPAIGARIVFHASGIDSWQIVDGSNNSSQFLQAIPNRQKLEPWLNQQLEILRPSLVSRLLPTRKKANSNSSNRHTHLRTDEFIYLCVLNRVNDCEEYLLLVTDFLLTASQQKSVSQRAHLLRDYLMAYRAHLQSQERVLEQRMRQVEHQLRNPLATIELFAETLCLQLPPGELREQAKCIKTAVDDLDDRLKQLLTSARPPGSNVRCDLRNIVLDAISVLKPNWQAKQLQIDVPETPLFVSVNRSQIKQVFENLLTNAIYFSPHGSAIICSWRPFHQEVLVEISDRGPGLRPQDVTSAFLPYYSRRQGGTGLGLTIAKRFIREHNGDIWCQTLPEGGAQFSFTLKKMALD